MMMELLLKSKKRMKTITKIRLYIAEALLNGALCFAPDNKPGKELKNVIAGYIVNKKDRPALTFSIRV
jgi:hypothetical protein